jgi:hypothetical protein
VFGAARWPDGAELWLDSGKVLGKGWGGEGSWTCGGMERLAWGWVSVDVGMDLLLRGGSVTEVVLLGDCVVLTRYRRQGLVLMTGLVQMAMR